MSENSKQYELSLVLQSEESYPEVLGLIKNKGFTVLKENSLARIKLMYPIKKQLSGVFTHLILDISPDRVSGLDSELKTISGVLRFLIVTPPVKEKTERGSRPLRDMKPRSSKPRGEAPEKKEPRKGTPEVISNELLEKKLEEILK